MIPQIILSLAGWRAGGSEMKLHDITRPITVDMSTYPGDPPTAIERVKDVARGDPFTLSAVSFGSHVGTHIDAPIHFFERGMSVDEIPLNVLIGEAVVVDANVESGITAEELERLSIRTTTSRLLMKTRQVSESYLTEHAAEWLIDRGVTLVGIDSQSVDKLDSKNLVVHRMLLEAGVVIVEDLDLSNVGAGRYTLVCLPMKLAGLDGAPVRAVLIEKSTVV